MYSRCIACHAMLGKNQALERRALAGEMWLLEREWEGPEALASISDDLLIPPSVDAWIRRQKARQGR